MTFHKLAARAACALALLLLTSAARAEEAVGDYAPDKVLAKYGPAVVCISGKVGGDSALGSGFLVSSDGQIVTNYHVVRGLYPAQVKLAGGDVYDDISVINYDARRDLAVIKVNGFNLPIVELGNSDEVKPGQRVTVIGNPEGFRNTVSDGLLSETRETGAGYKLYQMSAPVSPGSSGGPVFDSQGRVIGVAVLSVTEGQNLNFFVPINYARGLIGGPVKYGLKDLPQEKLGVETGDSSGPATRVETLKLLIEAVTDYYQAWDCAFLGLPRSEAAHMESEILSDELHFVPADVDGRVYEASELFLRAAKKAARAAQGTGEAADLARRYADPMKRTALAHEARVDIILDPPDSYGAEDARYHTAYNFAVGEVGALDPELAKLVGAQAPELVAALPPGAAPDLPPIQRGEGRIGVGMPLGSQQPWLIQVDRHSPAAKGGLKVGDVILGVVDGPDLPTQKECLLYLRAHPNQKIVLRVRRGKDEKKITVTPEPYKP